MPQRKDCCVFWCESLTLILPILYGTAACCGERANKTPTGGLHQSECGVWWDGTGIPLETWHHRSKWSNASFGFLSASTKNTVFSGASGFYCTTWLYTLTFCCPFGRGIVFAWLVAFMMQCCVIFLLHWLGSANGASDSSVESTLSADFQAFGLNKQKVQSHPIQSWQTSTFIIHHFIIQRACNLRHVSLIIPPSIIQSTSAEGLWSGMIRTQPIQLTGKGDEWCLLLCF